MEHNLLAPHVRLRPITEEDAAFVVALRQDHSRSRFLHSVENDLAAQREWIRGSLQRTAQLTEYYWVVEPLAHPPPTPIGLVRFSEVTADSFVFGSWVMAPHAPVTAGIEAYMAGCDFGFGTLGCPRYLAEVRLGNARMLAFQRRVGSAVRGDSAGCRHLELTRERYALFRRRYRRYVLDDEMPQPHVRTETSP